MKGQLYGRMGRQDARLTGQNIRGFTSLQLVSCYQLMVDHILLEPLTAFTSGEEPATPALSHPHNKVARRYKNLRGGGASRRKPTYFRDHATPCKFLPLPHSPTPRQPIRRIARPLKPQLSSRFDSRATQAIRALVARSDALLRCLAERFHEVALRVFAFPSWGLSSLSSRAKWLPAAPARPRS
jgi:hypothetical protein